MGRPLFSPEDFFEADLPPYTPAGQVLDRWLQVGAGVLAGGFLLVGYLLERRFTDPGAAGHTLSHFLYFLSYVAGSYYGLKAAFRSIAERSVDINVLMVVGAFLAAVIDAPAEGAFLLFLFTLSGGLERLAGERTSAALRSLTKVLPAEALVVRPEGPARVRLREVHVGDRVLIRPGDRVPVDGEIKEGRSLLDESSITGEFAPRAKGPGDAVFAGTINQDGSLTVEVKRPYQDTALARIRKMVLLAQEEKLQVQQVFDRFGRYYTGAALAGSAVFGLALWLGLGKPGGEALYRAITLLIVVSPCALIISVPTVALSALARAARAGVLLKGGGRLEELSTVRTVVVDKTGTLTTGEVRLVEAKGLTGFREDEVVAIAAALERSATHPLAVAVLRTAEERGIGVPTATDVRNLPGIGLLGRVAEETAFVGRPGAPFDGITREELEAATDGAGELRAAGATVAAVHSPGRVGLLAFRDTIRPEAARTVWLLRRLGIRRVLMLTGDSEDVARVVAAEVGLDGYRAGLMPEEKVEVVRALIAEGERVAMVGDGVNDAPALKSATVGIAMGGIGSNIAMEAADVVLVKDDFARLPFLFGLARSAHRTLLANIAFATGVILVLAGFTVARGVPLSVGVVGHEGSTLLVVANSLRLLVHRDAGAR